MGRAKTASGEPSNELAITEDRKTRLVIVVGVQILEVDGDTPCS
jgi:hypothetical protein